MSWRMVGLVIREQITIVGKEDLLFLRCPKCIEPLVWRPFRLIFAFSGSCCSNVFLARPTNAVGHTWRIDSKKADMRNVRTLSVVDR